MTKSKIGLPLLALLLGGCTFGVPIGDRGQGGAAPGPSAGAPERSARGNPSSYIVHGRRYFVMNDASGFVQRGIASWYGTKFHGRSTSSGETYNMHAMTAAHKTLPIPVYVHVRNLDNGRSAVVRVNDRGPFVEGRIIDLSWAAARKLGVDGPGTANVEISVVERGQRAPVRSVRTIPLNEQAARDVPMFIQMGSFASKRNAELLVAQLQLANESSAQISPLETGDGATFFRVRVGPLYDMDEANNVVRRLRGKGFGTTRIVIED